MKKFVEKVKKVLENPIVFFFGGFWILTAVIGAIIWAVKYL